MKHNTIRIKEDSKREAANREAEQRREKEKAARKANAEKQKRYREGMKAQGYKARLIWEKPLESGWVRAASPVIRKSSLNIAADNPAMKEVLGKLSGTFIYECKRQKIAERVWKPVYRDVLTLLKPLGIEG
ncbi:MAG: hypothetical protein LBP60_04985 [Spirochaetaceae bacterium]|jgi:hypothetical protein|nr:hypothetical protein [Spirochaetaceae bacterium]